MRPKYIRITYLAVILFLKAIISDAKLPDSILTLQKAVELGVVNSKLLKASKEKITIALAKLEQTNTQNLPSLKLGSTYTRISDNVTPFVVKFPGAPTETVLNPQILNQFSESINASQLIYAGGRFKKTLISLDFLKKASELDYQNDESGIIYNTITAFYNLYKLQQVKRILVENKNLLQARLKDLRNLEKNGLLLRNDVLKLELSLSQINIQQLDNSSAFDASKYAFNILLGLADTATYNLDTTGFFTYKLSQTYKYYEKIALSSRPDINANEKRVAASKLNIEVNKANYFPSITSNVSYSYLKPNQRIFPQRDQFDGTWLAGVSLLWDLSSLYNTKHYIKEAVSNYHQYTQQKMTFDDNVKIELYTNYLAYTKALEHLKLSEQTLNQANENYRLIEDRLKNNLVIIADLQDALNYLVQSQVNVLLDKADIDLAYFKFIKSAGILKN